MSGYTQKLRLIKLQVISLTENHVNLIFFDPLKKNSLDNPEQGVVI